MTNFKKIVLISLLISSVSFYGQKKYSLYGGTSLIEFEQVNFTLDGRYNFSPTFSFSTWSQKTNGIEQVQGGDYFASINTFNYSKKNSKSTLSLGLSTFKNKDISIDQFIIRLRVKVL